MFQINKHFKRLLWIDRQVYLKKGTKKVEKVKALWAYFRDNSPWKFVGKLFYIDFPYIWNWYLFIFYKLWKKTGIL